VKKLIIRRYQNNENVYEAYNEEDPEDFFRSTSGTRCMQWAIDHCNTSVITVRCSIEFNRIPEFDEPIRIRGTYFRVDSETENNGNIVFSGQAEFHNCTFDGNNIGSIALNITTANIRPREPKPISDSLSRRFEEEKKFAEEMFK